MAYSKPRARRVTFGEWYQPRVFKTQTTSPSVFWVFSAEAFAGFLIGSHLRFGLMDTQVSPRMNKLGCPPLNRESGSLSGIA